MPVNLSIKTYMYQYRVKRFKNKSASSFSDAVAVNIVSTFEDNQLGVRLYPNPVADHLIIDLSATDIDVTIQSLQGELLATFNLRNTTSSRLDLTDLPSGLFILTVWSGENRQRFKIVKEE